MTIQVDVWGGDLHQNHVGSMSFEAWDAASKLMLERVDEGHLCNVLHTDFKAPAGRAEEQEAALIAQLSSE